MQNIKLLRKQRTKTRQIENQLERLQQQNPLYITQKEEEFKLQAILEKPGNECTCLVDLLMMTFLLIGLF